MSQIILRHYIYYKYFPLLCLLFQHFFCDISCMVGNTFQTYQSIQEHNTCLCVALVIRKTLDVLTSKRNLKIICLRLFFNNFQSLLPASFCKCFICIFITIRTYIQHFFQLCSPHLREGHFLLIQGLRKFGNIFAVVTDTLNIGNHLEQMSDILMFLLANLQRTQLDCVICDACT